MISNSRAQAEGTRISYAEMPEIVDAIEVKTGSEHFLLVNDQLRVRDAARVIEGIIARKVPRLVA